MLIDLIISCYQMYKITTHLALCLIFILLPSPVSMFNLEILEPDVLEPMVFVNGKLGDYYNATVYEQHFVCTNGQLQIIQFQESPDDQLIVFRFSGAQLTRNDINITVQPNKEPKPFIKDFNRVFKKFTLDAGCPAVITKQNYYNRVKVTLTVNNQQSTRKVGTKNDKKMQPKIYQFNFLLNCDMWDVHKHFEYGYIFISLICITIVVFVSLHPRICSLVINHKPVNFQIKWRWFLLLMIVLLSVLGFIYSKKMVITPDINRYFGNRTEGEHRFQIANAFLKHLGLLLSLFYVYVCCSQLFFQWSFLLDFLPFTHVKIRKQTISRRALASGFISIICYIIALWNQNWIYYNLLSFCIAIGAIKMFRFRSLKNGVYTMLIVVISIGIFTIWSYFYLPRAVNDYASELSSPLFVQVPDLVNNLYKKCSWISIYDMILPGAVLAYLRDYDQNYHVGLKGVYTFTSIFSFSMSCVAWVVVQALIEYSIPFCILIYPPFMMTVLLVALYRNEFETIWNGYFHVSVDLAIMQMIEEYHVKDKHQTNPNHVFPKQLLQAIKYDQSRWSDNQSVLGNYRRPLDESQLQIWSATLSKRESQQSLTPSNKQFKSNLFISQNIPVKMRKQSLDVSPQKRVLSASSNQGKAAQQGTSKKKHQ